MWNHWTSTYYWHCFWQMAARISVLLNAKYYKWEYTINTDTYIYIKRYSDHLQVVHLEETRRWNMYKSFKKNVGWDASGCFSSPLSRASTSAVWTDCRPALRLLPAAGWCCSEQTVWDRRNPDWTNTPDTSSTAWNALWNWGPCPLSPANTSGESR